MIINKNQCTIYQLPTANSRLLFFFISFFLFFILSCNRFDPEEEIPSYIRIKKVDFETTVLQGNNSHSINHVWVYLNKKIVGVFELPAIIPLVTSGYQPLQIFAGVNSDGILMSRITYPYFSAYEISIDLKRDSVMELIPKFQYGDNVKIPYPVWEKFDGIGNSFESSPSSEVDSFTIGFDSLDYIDKFGLIQSKKGEKQIIDFSSVDKVYINQNTRPVYLELDYYSNMEFSVGVYSHSPSGSVIAVLDLVLRPRSTWKKIYVNLTDEINMQTKGSLFKILFYGKSSGNDSIPSYIALDNIKLLVFNE